VQHSETEQIPDSEQLVPPKIKNKSPSKKFDDIKSEWNIAHENLSKSFQELTGIFAQINFLLEQLESQLGALEKDSGVSDIVTAHKKAMTGMSGLVGGVGEANIHLEQFEKNNLNKLTPDAIKTLDNLKREMTNATRVLNGIKVGASVPTTTQNGQRVQTQRQARNGTGATDAESEASDVSEKSRIIRSSRTSDSSSEARKTSRKEDDESFARNETIEANASNEVSEIKTELEKNLAEINDGSAKLTEGENENFNNVSSNSEYDGSIEEAEDFVETDEVNDQPGSGINQSTEDQIENQVNSHQNIGNNKNVDISESLVNSDD
jgi:hypothetical protein